MTRVDDDDDITNMMEGSSSIAMYVSNRPIESDSIEYRPPTVTDNGPSRLVISSRPEHVSNRPIVLGSIEYQPPTVPDNGPSRLAISSRSEQLVQSEGAASIEDEHNSEIERHIDDIDPIKSPLRINRSEVVLRQYQDFDDVQACHNHLIDYAISQNFNIKFINSEERRV
ncbi:hypothetical protein AMTR_s00007p00249340 [Amborella trichopoda]|uniref:Transposase MuDR plant domain-containing protein n=1 Tax=Amborella trichopoda TaxID=13333 RepID=W1PCV7_AMBTC|nr:hypothetical protein AMTR_s00007p00249340 [Amborella trichopoda]